MNALTPTRYCPADLLEKLDNNIHPWLLSEREGGNRTTLSYVKVDILTDTLNKLFGPLGWGVEAEIQKMDDFQYEKPGYNNSPASEMYVFQVISQVKLTIKPQTDGGSPTVFIQSGIGYGEVKVNAHRKDAVGMAVKGAESDGLKRCCNLLGRAFGMFLVGGKQDPVVYAHNGNKNKAVLNRAQRERDDYERNERGDRSQNDRGQDDGGRSGDRDDRGSRDNRREDRQDDASRRSGSSEREGRDDNRQRQERSGRDDRQDSRGRDDREGRSEGSDDDRRDPPRQQRGTEGGKAADEERGGGEKPQDDEKGGSRRRSTARSADEGDGKSGGDKEQGKKGGEEAGDGKRRASTTYDLRKVPVTRDNQKDFGATFIKQIEGMRQAEDQQQMLKTYAQRVNELDPDIRALVVERLRERSVDVSLLED